MANNLVISADCTCDLNQNLKEQYDVKLFPFYIRLRDKEYRDGIDIFPDDIYKAYYEDKSLPSTAASSIGDYMKHFEQFTKEGKEVVHITLGSALSSARDNAQMAAEQMDGVYVVDSCSLSTGSGLLVINAAKLADQGKPAKEIADILEDTKKRVHASFVLDGLDFMAAGGRCPAVAAKAAGMLKCKPGLKVSTKDGSLSFNKMYRGKPSKVLKQYVKDELDGMNVETEDIFVTHSGIDEELLNMVIEEVKTYGKFDNIHTSVANCTIASHCGPATLGVLFIEKP